jgi:N-succinyldiaminopimelate aminotransferase
VYDVLKEVLDVKLPAAGFYLWPQLPCDDQQFAKNLYARQHVTVVPGTYLSRDAHGINPGRSHVRLALVALEQECMEAAYRIRECVQSL